VSNEQRVSEFRLPIKMAGAKLQKRSSLLAPCHVAGQMKHRRPIAIFSLMIIIGIFVALLAVLLQGAKFFPWFPLFGIGMAIFMVGFFFLLYSIIFGALEWGSKIGKSKRG
jgi:hypothetical protein